MAWSEALTREYGRKALAIGDMIMRSVGRAHAAGVKVQLVMKGGAIAGDRRDR